MTSRPRSLSLDCLTLPDVAPVDLLRVADEVGYGSISLWVQPPAMFEVMLATHAMSADLTRALADSSIVVGNLEVFNLNTDEPIAQFEPAIALGAGLGAATATAIDFGSPRADIAERLAAFHALCAQHGIVALVEPISMGNVRTPQDGLDLIQTAGVEAKPDRAFNAVGTVVLEHPQTFRMNAAPGCKVAPHQPRAMQASPM